MNPTITDNIDRPRRGLAPSRAGATDNPENRAPAAPDPQGAGWPDEGWEIVRTPTFEYITSQLELCRRGSLSCLFADVPNIGKSVAARHYAFNNPNTAYVDCSRFKTKWRLLREICRLLGIPGHGPYYAMFDRLVYNLCSMDCPLVILDEAGDLGHDAFLEIKALWNATEYSCGWYMMGADGLKKKIEKRICSRQVGYAEVFSRYGDGFRRVTPLAEEERAQFLLHQATMIARANTRPGQDADKLARQCGGSARAVRHAIRKTAGGDGK